eukprot:GHUV01046279.1.p2 GENE.GHUV01046279.1~~GHUV01046279.1.p2  ORF type:complete len:101 (+),score=14.63 GHUV01046279.1:366-668(+)
MHSSLLVLCPIEAGCCDKRTATACVQTAWAMYTSNLCCWEQGAHEDQQSCRPLLVRLPLIQSLYSTGMLPFTECMPAREHSVAAANWRRRSANTICCSLD